MRLMIPGEYILGKGDIECNVGRRTCKVAVVNTGDRPVQVGSHFHFFEVNRQMEFDRAQAFGMRLNIPAGTAVRFEPGEEKEVELVTFGGKRSAFGINNLVNGNTTSEGDKLKAVTKLQSLNFKNKQL
jgi:urease subunit beta